MQCQSWSNGAIGQLAGPSAHQLPGAQAEVFGHQQKQAQEVARNLISQELANLPFHAAIVGELELGLFSGALRGDFWWRIFRIEAVEFFFECRNRR